MQFILKYDINIRKIKRHNFLLRTSNIIVGMLLMCLMLLSDHQQKLHTISFAISYSNMCPRCKGASNGN